VLVATVLLAAAAAFGGWVWLNQQFDAEGPAGPEQTVLLAARLRLDRHRRSARARRPDQPTPRFSG
jgi:hypothetical protein